MRQKTKSVSKFFYILSVGFFFVSLLTGELKGYVSGLSKISNLLACFMFVLIFMGSILSLREKVYAYPWMYAGFFLVAALFWNVSYFLCSIRLKPHEQINAWAGLIGLNVSLLCWIINGFRSRKQKSRRGFPWKRYIPLGVLCLIFVLLFLLNFDVWFHMDAEQYYSYVADHAGKWNFRFANMEPLRTCEHTCYAFSILLTIGELLAPYWGYGQRAVVLIMSVAAIISFYLITEKIWGTDKRLRSVLLTAVFAFAPTFYGISYLISTDFALLFFFTLLVLGAFYNIKFLKFISILAVCFSKENGVFVLAGFYLGEVIACAVKEKKTVRGFFGELFSGKRIAMYSAAFLDVLILFFGSGGWANAFRSTFSSTVSADIPEYTYVRWHYPAFKIFEYFFMNFNWVIWVLLLIACISVIVYCRKEKTRIRQFVGEKISAGADYYIPIVIAYAAFCAVGILYLTYIHYRYIQLGHLFYVLCLGIILDFIPKMFLKRDLLLFPVLIAMTVESFVTVDPVTHLFLHDFSTGNGNMVSTRQCWYIITDEETGAGYFWETDEEIIAQHYLAEGTEYNREIIGLQRVVEQALRRIDYSSDKLIVLDVFGGWETWTCAQLFGVYDGNGWFWDPKVGTVVRYETDVPLCLAYDTQDLKPFMDSFSEIYYIDFPMNRYHKNDVLKNYPAIDSFSESYMRWKIDAYRLK